MISRNICSKFLSGEEIDRYKKELQRRDTRCCSRHKNYTHFSLNYTTHCVNICLEMRSSACQKMSFLQLPTWHYGKNARDTSDGDISAPPYVLIPISVGPTHNYNTGNVIFWFFFYNKWCENMSLACE